MTLRRGGREMGEGMNRSKTACAAGVLLGFKILATLHRRRGRSGIRSNKWTQIMHFNSSCRIASSSNRSPLKKKMGTDTTQLKKVPLQAPLINTRILAYALYTPHLLVSGSATPYSPPPSIGLQLYPTNGSRWGKSIDQSPPDTPTKGRKEKDSAIRDSLACVMHKGWALIP